jgi:microcompartment protein CcmK/EutM
MRIAEVVGTVTLSRFGPGMAGGRFKLVVPLSLADLRTNSSERLAEDLIAYDELGAGIGDRILLSEGPEAAQPFYPDKVPVDAYCAGIIDEISLEPGD